MDLVNQSEISKKLMSDYEEFKRNTPNPNVLIIGGTGVGKSSLINRCFNADLAQAGVGKPVTQQLNRYQDDKLPIVIYDTKGYEIGEGLSEQFIETVMQYFDGKGTDGNYIHIAWYCIQASGHRVTDFDLRVIEKIKNRNIPIAVVLTKSELISEDEAKQMRAVVSEKWKIPFFETSSRDTRSDWDIEKLCQWTIHNLPEGMRTAFIAAQRGGLESKRAESEKFIKQHVTAAFGVAFMPIPFSDAPLLVANQAGLVARIIYVYGLQNVIKVDSQALFTTFLGPVISRAAVSVAGSLLKFIPLIGSIMGGAINAAVASTVTWAIGRSTMALCEYMVEQGLDGDLNNVNLDTLVNVFKTKFEEQMEVSKK